MYCLVLYLFQSTLLQLKYVQLKPNSPSLMERHAARHSPHIHLQHNPPISTRQTIERASDVTRCCNVERADSERSVRKRGAALSK